MKHRRRSYKRAKQTALAFILAIAFCIFKPKIFLFVLIPTIIITTIVLVIRKRNINKASAPSDNSKTSDKIPSYTLKKSLITPSEMKFFTAIKNIVGKDLIVQPQVNLASIITKSSDAKYHNELFRNVDFGIFDTDYRPIALIEINDPTHYQVDRRKRDHKVQHICEIAQIPLITLWTEYGINEEYIRKRLHPYIVAYQSKPDTDPTPDPFFDEKDFIY